MRDTIHKILVWLPSPMGDAVLCTPALRAIRKYFSSSQITFLANPIVRQVLSPCSFNDAWIEPQGNNPLAVAAKLKAHKFTHAILFKNSFASALAVALARIPCRIGYAREGRALLLTDKLHPPKLPNGKFKPLSMLDYYLAIASRLGADTADRSLGLQFDQKDSQQLRTKLPKVIGSENPLVILVPGGAFGPSKCWPSENFAKTADWLITNHGVTVVISAAANAAEKQIAAEICASAKSSLRAQRSASSNSSLRAQRSASSNSSLRAQSSNSSNSSLRAQRSNLDYKLVNLAENPVNLGELKALFSIADLVVTNDTGPRHIATALGRKVVTLFGPNDPAWTNTDYENEIQIVGNVPCAPCTKPTCTKPEHLCMQAITVEMVCDAAKELLRGRRTRAKIFARPEFEETAKSFFVNPDYKTALAKLGLISLDAVFSFSDAESLTKSNLAPFRTRLQFEIDSLESSAPTTLFLKRYDSPPILVQLKNWLAHHSRRSCASCELEPTNELPAAGINAPKAISYGEQWGAFFEKKSFIITEKIPDAEALERKLPDCFGAPPTPENLKLRRNFIAQLAIFIKKFHDTNYRHRDLYFSHIFRSNSGDFYLIDLARAFKPLILQTRFLVKDIAQAYYSAPAAYFSNTDRLRFYLAYTAQSKLRSQDKAFIRKVITRAKRMASHDRKHGRTVPFARRPN